jgi:hypothetical protein
VDFDRGMRNYSYYDTGISQTNELKSLITIAGQEFAVSLSDKKLFNLEMVRYLIF